MIILSITWNKDENAIIPEHHHPNAGKRIKVFVRFPRIFLVSDTRCHNGTQRESLRKKDILHVGKRHIDNHKEGIHVVQSPGRHMRPVFCIPRKIIKIAQAKVSAQQQLDASP